MAAAVDWTSGCHNVTALHTRFASLRGTKQSSKTIYLLNGFAPLLFTRNDAGEPMNYHIVI